MLGRLSDISAVAFEVAMFVTFGDPCAIHRETGAFTGAAIAGYSEFSGAVAAGDELPASSLAELAIFKRHRRTSIRARVAKGKVCAMWNSVKEKSTTESQDTEFGIETSENKRIERERFNAEARRFAEKKEREKRKEREKKKSERE